MGKPLATLTGILLLATGIAGQRGPDSPGPQMPSGDPFKISPGTSFSASSPNAGGQARSRSRRHAPARSLLADIDEALAVIENNYVSRERAGSDEIHESSLRAMLRALDPHSNYYSPADFAELVGEHNNEYSGTGSTIVNFRHGGRVETYVLVVAAGSAAERAGLSYGDRIVAVDGREVTGMSAFAVRELVRGPRGTDVRMTIEHAGSGATRTLRLTRERVEQRTVNRAFMLENATGYIAIGGFSNTTAIEFDAALNGLKASGVKSLVLDLRGNSGGIFDEAVEVAERFLPRGTVIVSQRGRYPYLDRTWRSKNMAPEAMPLVILADGATASAAEILAGALQDNDRALIVGERTFGKGLVQNVLELPEGGGITLTAARYMTPAGRSIQRDYSDGSLYDYYSQTKRPAMINKAAFAVRTLTNRTVYGGDGIAPDVALEPCSLTNDEVELQDTVFFYTVELLEGRAIPGIDRETIRQDVIFGRDLVSDQIVAAFRVFTDGRENTANTGHPLTADNGYVADQLRYYLSLGAFGMDAAENARINDDPLIEKAVAEIPRADKLARAAAAVRRVR